MALSFGQLAGLSLGGGGLSFLGGKHLQNDAQSFSREMMRNRHQWEVADLKAAGLNPILSAGSAPSMGSSPMASSPDFATPLVNSAKVASELPLNETKNFVLQAEQLIKENLIPGSEAAKKLMETTNTWIDTVLNKSKLGDPAFINNILDSGAKTLSNVLTKLESFGHDISKLVRKIEHAFNEMQKGNPKFQLPGPLKWIWDKL